MEEPTRTKAGLYQVATKFDEQAQKLTIWQKHDAGLPSPGGEACCWQVNSLDWGRLTHRTATRGCRCCSILHENHGIALFLLIGVFVLIFDFQEDLSELCEHQDEDTNANENVQDGEKFSSICFWSQISQSHSRCSCYAEIK
jgi:hypothetical protein